MPLLTLKEINEIDLVDYLAKLGHQPKRISGPYYWYLSMLPDRQEKTPSFRVNRRLNRWRDWGTGQGTSVVDFGILYFDCTIHELVISLSGPAASFDNVPRKKPPVYIEPEKKIQIVKTADISTLGLVQYLETRRIPLSVARQYCREVHYSFGQPKKYFAIGFRCDDGGFELRNKYHKYGSSPKSPTYIFNGSEDIAVFEGFFDLLTFVSLLHCPDKEMPDLLVLNSATFFTSYLPLIESFPYKHLFLDNDPTGDKYTKMAVERAKGFVDHRPQYQGFKDLNEWAVETGKTTIPCLRESRFAMLRRLAEERATAAAEAAALAAPRINARNAKKTVTRFSKAQQPE